MRHGSGEGADVAACEGVRGMRVGVIGAGIGGLCTAVGLARVGVDVTVFERAHDLRPGGSGLSVFGNGIAALDALGLGDAFRAATSAEAVRFRAGQRTPDGAWLTTVPSDVAGELRIIHRRDLHEMLVAALPAGVLQPGSAVTHVADDGRTLRADRGGAQRAERFDVVVAADGIRSTVRAAWPGDGGLRYSGYSAWRGVTAVPVDLAGEAGETWGRGIRFGVAPLSDGRVYWFGVANMAPDAVVGDEHARVCELFGHWHEPIPRVLSATDPAEVLRLPVHDLSRALPTFRRGRCVLLGDAAHAMTPDLGQGGGQAMEDAATLVTLLGAVAARLRTGEAADIDQALAEYDRIRRARTQPIARRARALGAVAQWEGRTAVGVRNALLRLAPTRLLARQAATLQSWHPPRDLAP